MRRSITSRTRFAKACLKTRVKQASVRGGVSGSRNMSLLKPLKNVLEVLMSIVKAESKFASFDLSRARLGSPSSR